eukprot:GSA25T00005071001.1
MASLLNESWVQISALRCVNRLCRLEPKFCGDFADLVLHISDSFQMNPLTSFNAGRQIDSQAAMTRAVFDSSPKTSVLYAEIIFLFAALVARSPYAITVKLMQRLNSHANQWFNLGYLFELLPQHLEHYLAAQASA